MVRGTVIQIEVWMEENSRTCTTLFMDGGRKEARIKSSRMKSTNTMRRRTRMSAAARARR